MAAHLEDERAIFLAALEKDSPQEQTAYVQGACAGDPELRRRVEELLAAHQESLGPFDLPPPGVESPPTSAGAIERPGAVIGPYKLLQQIGEGGMGTVYMAEQFHPVKRMVALKVIKAGMDSGQVIARFEAERQALALMDHPNIAKVLDAGTTAAGRPYFVMELVKGVPITTYCDENHLPPKVRLELFTQVCQAVQHAHQKGIIHRDLKPTNVLVTLYDDKPVPKVIDFGVSKATGGRLTERTMFTGYGQIVGTLEYMSPEQARLNALDIDTRSDIYSLGVLLYELLTGQTPVDKKRLRGAAFDEMLRVIREEDPPKPSTRLSTAEGRASIAANRGTEPARLVKLIRGELDWIVMKALEKDRSRRYETANGLAHDIQHYLHDEPVVACPPSRGYRFRKFIRRNKAALSTAGVILVALLVAVIGLAVSNFIVRAERNEKTAALEGKEKALGEKQVALKEAKTNADNARKQQGIAQEQEKLARRRFYAAQMNLAKEAWEDGHPARMLQLLESQRPRFDEDDLRGFDWYYLWRLCQGTRRFSVPVLGVDNASIFAISPDGTTLATVYPGAVRLWAMAEGRQVDELPEQQAGWIAFAPDSKTLAVTDESESVNLWDLSTRTIRGAIKPGDLVGRMQFTGDGQKLVLGGNSIRIWDLASSGVVAQLSDGDITPFRFLATSPDGGAVAASGENIVRVWIRDGDGWREAPPIERAGFYQCVAISPDGTLLAVGSKLYDLPDCRLRLSLDGHTGPVYGVAFTADGKRLVSGGMDRTVRIWDVETGKEAACLAQPGPVYGLAITPDGQTVAAKGAAIIHVSDVASPAPSSVLPHLTQVEAVAFSPDGKTLACRGDQETKLWDVSQERTLATLATPAPSTWLRGLAYSPNGESLAISRGPGVDLWSVSGQKLAELTCEANVHRLAWSPDGSSIAVATQTGLEVWDAPARQRRYSTRAGNYTGNSTLSVAFSPNGKLLAAGYQYGVVKLFDAASGRELYTLQRFELAIDGTFALAFSPDSRKLATGSQLGLVRIWDVATNQLDATLSGHTNGVRSLAFLDRGRTLASGSEDHTVRLWDVETGQERIALTGHTGDVTGLAYSEAGSVLASSSQDGTVRLWRAATDHYARAPQAELEAEGGKSPVAENEFGDRSWQAGRPDEAEAAYRRALERLEKLRAAREARRISEGHDEIAYQRESIRSLLSISLLLRIERGDLAGAEAAHARAMEIYRQLAPQEQRTLFHVFNERQRKLRTSGANAQADRTWSQVLEFLPQDNAQWLTRAAHQFITCSGDPRLRNPARAAELARQAVALPPKDKFDLASALAYLGMALEDDGRRAEAEDAYRRATTLWREVTVEDSGNGYGLVRAWHSSELVNVLRAAGRTEEALELCRAKVRLGEQHAKEFSGQIHAQRTAWARNLLISLLTSLGRHEEAAKVTREQEKYVAAREALRNSAPSPSPPPKDQGWTLLKEEKFAEAEEAFREAIQRQPDDAQAHRGLGVSLQMQKRIPEAIASLRESIRLNPAEYWAHEKLGWIVLEQQQPAEAEAAFREAVRIQPALASGHVGLGRSLREQKKFPEAVVSLREAVRLDPAHHHARNQLGWTLFELKQVSEAEVEFRECIRLNPESEGAHFALAAALRGQKEFAEAVASVRKGIELAPADHQGYEQLGQTFLEAQQFADAEVAFREVVRLKPDSVSGHFELGKSLVEQKEYAEAETELREALRLAPDHAWAPGCLSRVLLGAGKLAEAESFLTEVVGRKPDVIEHRLNLAEVFRRQRNFDDAEVELQEAIQRRPTRPDAHEKLGWLLYEQKEYSQAESAFREAVRLKPDAPGAQAGLGRALMDQEKLSEALEPLREALRLDPSLHSARDGLGWTYVKSGEFAKAELEFREAIRLKPELAGGHVGLGRALVEQKKFADAETPLREALRLNPSHGAVRPLLSRALAGQGKTAEAQSIFKENP